LFFIGIDIVEVELLGVNIVLPGVDAVPSGLRGLFHPIRVCGKISSGLGLLGDGGSSAVVSDGGLVSSFLEFFGGL
jgi:hypothetical protein